MTRLASLTALLCLAPLGAGAEPIAVTFAGMVTEIRPQIDDGTFALGDPVSGSFQIDPEAVDGNPDPDAALYPDAVSDFSVAFGDYEASDSAGLLLIRNGMTPNTDEFYVETSPTGADVAGFPLFRSILLLTDSDLSVFSGDAIPLALDLADFENRTLTLEYMDPPFSYPVIAELTSLAYEPAPEPGGALSLAAGMLVLGLCRLARRRP
jgi:hypothetical protein